MQRAKVVISSILLLVAITTLAGLAYPSVPTYLSETTTASTTYGYYRSTIHYELSTFPTTTSGATTWGLSAACSSLYPSAAYCSFYSSVYENFTSTYVATLELTVTTSTENLNITIPVTQSVTIIASQVTAVPLYSAYGLSGYEFDALASLLLVLLLGLVLSITRRHPINPT